MKYNVVHNTEYHYGEPVPLCHNIVHLQPRQTATQRVLSHHLTITPNPLIRSERTDFYGNASTWFCVQEPHQSLRILGRSVVEVEGEIPQPQQWWPSWEQVVEQVRTRHEGVYLDARQFVFASPHVTIDAKLVEYAQPSFTERRSLFEATLDLTKRIHDEFKFDSNVTTVGTPTLEVLEHRHGVCQDFAHLQIGCLRSLGLPARYVSGYLVTHPAPGQPKLVGADASHAWVSVFFPEFGWIDFDPTNGLIPTTGHITLAWARDYEEISPVRGVVVGGRRHSLEVGVDVNPVKA